MTDKKSKIREAVGVFEELDIMQEAIKELEISGFPRTHISILGSEAVVKDIYGKRSVDTEKLEDDKKAPHASNIAPEEVGVGQGAVISTGIFTGVMAALIATGAVFAVPAVAITTAFVGGAGGGAVGVAFAKVLGDKYEESFQKQIDSGGILLWILTADSHAEETAQKILKKYGAKDVHIHELKNEEKE